MDKMKIYLNTLFLITLITIGFNSHGTEREDVKKTTNERPNILFILADDHRWDLLGKNHPIIKTPNLDVLASQGVSFSNSFVTTPICASSRVSILTGLTERTHDFTFSRPATGVIESDNIYPKKLKDSGYTSGFVGKYEIKLSGDDSDRFDYFEPLLHSKTNTYKGSEIPQTHYITQRAKDFIANMHDSSEPWVLNVNFWNPHALDSDKENQYHYPAKFENLYSDITIPPAKLSDDETFAALPEFLRKSIGRVRWEYRYANDAMYQKMIKRHYRAISAVDEGVGQIITQLEKLGMLQNTIIIYTGDNGYSLNERQLAGKWFGWEEDLRVPLIIRDPRNSEHKGVSVDETVLNIDIAPTILDYAGVAIPQTYQGNSLVGLVEDGKMPSWRDEFFFEHMYQPKRVSIPPMVGVRTDNWKFVDFYKNNYLQLYNLIEDPQEKFNLATLPEYKSKVKYFRKRTGEYIKMYEDQRTIEVKERTHFLNSTE
ncbi:sulfatase-like hydrolase/transferase [Pseudoalteromonas sp. Angola-30]|uniref:sulfatase-like hydrolase/transferase n=1 Tax=Pseudoalteromonas sp. Angola-30 TaxID=3025341 RepID=UPI002358FDDA|nr:sulfatase-like hydrolase/transferase [Pseudoalteromonas sp. Angola-30]MDC9526812.1 sulfatase-like hydrolase/transferase [Pseudoalteromonas sp. Angola-30]